MRMWIIQDVLLLFYLQAVQKIPVQQYRRKAHYAPCSKRYEPQYIFERRHITTATGKSKFECLWADQWEFYMLTTRILLAQLGTAHTTAGFLYTSQSNNTYKQTSPVLTSQLLVHHFGLPPMGGFCLKLGSEGSLRPLLEEHKNESKNESTSDYLLLES